MPRHLQEPFWNPPEGSGPWQNTDPLVFGDQFLYTNCRQERNSNLRALAPGSIILFGSKLRGVFVVDTVAGEVGVIDARLAGRRALVAGDLTQAIGRARHDDHIVSPLSCAAVYDRSIQ